MEFTIFLWAWGSVVFMSLNYLLCGAYLDTRKKLDHHRRQKVLGNLSILLFDSSDDAAAVHEDLASTNRTVLLNVIQSLALDVNGEARSRLQQLSRSSGLERHIRRRARHRRWRHRVQAAQLHYLVTHPDFDRSPLLRDKHSLVRARAAETLTAEQCVSHIDDLMVLLSDESLAVRLAAQNSLLRAGAAAIEPLLVKLNDEGPHIAEAMEVAADLPDPRLVAALTRYATAADPRQREMAAKALGSGTGVGAIDVLNKLLDDDSPDVRANAIGGLQRLESHESVAAIGRCLSDSAWRVRRAAGYALDEMSAPGQLVLRRALEDPDPYARDMARQVLDGSMAASARMSSTARAAEVPANA